MSELMSNADHESIKGPDDLLQDFRDQTPEVKPAPEVKAEIVSIDDLRAKAQRLSDAAITAGIEADTYAQLAAKAKEAHAAALAEIFDAEQAQRKARADELSKLANDAALQAALAQAAAIAAQTEASEARAEFQGDSQTCTNCGTLIPGKVAAGRLVNCPKCDRNFPAQ